MVMNLNLVNARHCTLSQSLDVSSSSEDGGSGLSSLALDGGSVTVDEAFVSGAWGVGAGSAAHPNVVTRGTRRLVSRGDRARCQFCEFPFSSSVSSAQHMARNHPGCGRQMDDVRCGGLLRDNYVLCPSCMIFYSNTVPAAASVAATTAVSEAAAVAARRRGVPATAQRSCSISSSSGGGVRERASRRGKVGYSITMRRKGRKASGAEAAVVDADAPDLLAVDWESPDVGEGDDAYCYDAIAELSDLSPQDQATMFATCLSQDMIVLREVAACSGSFSFDTLKLHGSASKDPLGQASVNTDPSKSALRDKSGSGDAASSAPPPHPLWAQASKLRSRSDNVKALRRLDDLGRFQLAMAAANVTLEAASARVQCGKPREAARLLAASGLGDVPQLYAVLRVLEEVEGMTARGVRSTARDDVRREAVIEVMRNALRAIVSADSAALGMLSFLVTQELMTFERMAAEGENILPHQLTVAATELIVDTLANSEDTNGNDITGKDTIIMKEMQC